MALRVDISVLEKALACLFSAPCCAGHRSQRLQASGCVMQKDPLRRLRTEASHPLVLLYGSADGLVKLFFDRTGSVLVVRADFRALEGHFS